MILLVAVILSFGLLSYAGEVINDGGGYQDLSWGSSLEQVKVKFPGITKAEGGKHFQLIKEKQVISFFIEKDIGLWCVYVSYEPLAATVPTKVSKLLSETYGPATKGYKGLVGLKAMAICVWELKKGGIFCVWGHPSDGESEYFKVSYVCKELFGDILKAVAKDSFVPLKLINNSDVEL